jgi:hypothetical protein
LIVCVFVAARLAIRKLAKPSAISAAMATFDPDLLAALAAQLDRATVLRYERGSVIVRR